MLTQSLPSPFDEQAVYIFNIEAIPSDQPNRVPCYERLTPAREPLKPCSLREEDWSQKTTVPIKDIEGPCPWIEPELGERV